MKKPPDLNHVKKLKLTGTTQATAYSFRREDGAHGDWAICTVNDGTGELSIQSDWGNWSHRWGTDHLGVPTLTEFISDRSSYHYLADKLSATEGRQAATAFDADATIAYFREILLERRKDDARDITPWVVARRGVLTRTEARRIWDELGELSRHDDNADEFIRGFLDIEDVGLYVTNEPYYHLASRPTPTYLVLLHGILPALVEACALEHAKRVESSKSSPSLNQPVPS